MSTMGTQHEEYSMHYVHPHQGVKFYSLLLWIGILPFTLFLDLLLYGFLHTCPSCVSFSQFIQTEGALSFPIVAGCMEWLVRLMKDHS